MPLLIAALLAWLQSRGRELSQLVILVIEELMALGINQPMVVIMSVCKTVPPVLQVAILIML